MAASPVRSGVLPRLEKDLAPLKQDAQAAPDESSSGELQVGEEFPVSSAGSRPAAAIAAASSGHQKENAGEREAEGPISKNRLSSGRHGERIPCPMDRSHCIYAFRLQAHLKKCTKARDIAFSHCLPFMQPGANLPMHRKQETMPEHYEEERQQQQKEHAGCSEAPDAAVPLTADFESNVMEAYKQCAALLCDRVASATAVPAADVTASPEVPREARRQLPAAEYIDKCCGGRQKDTASSGMDAVLMLRAAADACKVPLGNKGALAEGPSVAFLEAEIERASRLQQQEQLLLLQQLLQQLQRKLNKHQQQMLQLLAVCLCEGHLTPHACDQTLALELGAGKGDLTRWLCCWSAVAVAARAPAATAPAATAAAGALAKAGQGCSSTEAASVRHAGIRCIVVDREARRYCKEAKDKTFRSPKSKRSVNPAAAGAVVTEKRNAASRASASATSAKNSNSFNPLLDEEDPAKLSEVKKARKDLTTAADACGGASGSSSACINSSNNSSSSNSSSSSNNSSSSILDHAEADKVEPFPPVRLRMDIADFSLCALMNFIVGKGPLRVPHIPAFFEELFSYGCRFRTFDEGRGDSKGDAVKRDPAERLWKATTVDEEPTTSATRGTDNPKSRLLCSVNDGSADEFFQLAQALGEGGGPDVKKIDMTLEEHFKDSRIRRVIGVAKHLCGGGSDVALRCFASATSAHRAACDFCICIATCCHHRCSVDSFVGTDYLQTLGFTSTELPLLFSLSSWATGATGRKQEVGAMIKRILDVSRVWWLRQQGFTSATIQKFVAETETPECYVITASLKASSSEE
ncbi:hypothetical protein Esti_005526 [Eimeria stiedai]